MRGDMAEIRLDYTRHDTDARGNVRWYYYRRGEPKVRLNPRGVEIGSPEFFRRYQAAVSGAIKGRRKKAEYQSGTLSHLIEQYLVSPEFGALRRNTQSARGRILKHLQDEHGSKSADIPSDAIRAGRDARRATPAAANERVKVISALYSWAIERGLAANNPAKGIKRLKEGAGYHAWSEAEIEAYRAHWPIGSTPRLAMELLFGTAQRRGDVSRMGPSHIAGDVIRLVQEKTSTPLTIPLTDALAQAIRETPAHSPGRFFHYKSPESFGNAFARWVKAAGLPDNCRAHGLRHARASLLADQGATPHEIAAVTGHKSLQEVQRYTQGADQERLARRAMGEQSVPALRPIPKTGTIGESNDQ